MFTVYKATKTPTGSLPISHGVLKVLCMATGRGWLLEQVSYGKEAPLESRMLLAPTASEADSWIMRAVVRDPSDSFSLLGPGLP